MPTAPTAPMGPTWTVSGQTPASRQGPNGRYVDGTVITFTTATGVVSTVFVTATNYANVTYVKRAIANKAAAVHAISKLSSEA